MNSGLEVSNLQVSYGVISAIKKLSFEVSQGELFAVLGANGAGKSTLVRALSGLISAQGGEVHWNGLSTLGKRPEDLVRMGIVHLAEGKSVIPELSVKENLDLGGLWRKDKNDVAIAIEESLTIFPALSKRLRQSADTLSGGERQMLAIARALISRPELLLLDEPSLGLAPLIIEEIFVALNNLRLHRGLTVLLIEQNARSALRIADRALVLGLGEIVASGTPEELLSNTQLRDSYLGIS
jgi:branched-chain amino acid transport system ATP-binding protein